MKNNCVALFGAGEGSWILRVEILPGNSYVRFRFDMGPGYEYSRQVIDVDIDSFNRLCRDIKENIVMKRLDRSETTMEPAWRYTTGMGNIDMFKVKHPVEAIIIMGCGNKHEESATVAISYYEELCEMALRFENMMSQSY